MVTADAATAEAALTPRLEHDPDEDDPLGLVRIWQEVRDVDHVAEKLARLSQ